MPETQAEQVEETIGVSARDCPDEFHRDNICGSHDITSGNVLGPVGQPILREDESVLSSKDRTDDSRVMQQEQVRNAAVSLCFRSSCWKAMEKVASFLIINYGLMISLINNLGLLLLRRVTGYTRTRKKQRRRLGSGYWTRRRVYWRRRKISRTAYIAEAVQGSIKQRIYSQAESQKRKEELAQMKLQMVLFIKILRT